MSLKDILSPDSRETPEEIKKLAQECGVDLEKILKSKPRIKAYTPGALAGFRSKDEVDAHLAGKPRPFPFIEEVGALISAQKVAEASKQDDIATALMLAILTLQYASGLTKPGLRYGDIAIRVLRATDSSGYSPDELDFAPTFDAEWERIKEAYKKLESGEITAQGFGEIIGGLVHYR